MRRADTNTMEFTHKYTYLVGKASLDISECDEDFANKVRFIASNFLILIVLNSPYW